MWLLKGLFNKDWNHHTHSVTTEQTLFPDEDCVIRSKALEQAKKWTLSWDFFYQLLLKVKTERSNCQTKQHEQFKFIYCGFITYKICNHWSIIYNLCDAQVCDLWSERGEYLQAVYRLDNSWTALVDLSCKQTPDQTRSHKHTFSLVLLWRWVRLFITDSDPFYIWTWVWFLCGLLESRILLWLNGNRPQISFLSLRNLFFIMQSFIAAGRPFGPRFCLTCQASVHKFELKF